MTRAHSSTHNLQLIINEWLFNFENQVHNLFLFTDRYSDCVVCIYDDYDELRDLQLQLILYYNYHFVCFFYYFHF